MKLSDGTIAVLKSFSQINPSIKITPGNTLATISPLKTLLAKATIEDTFESGFSIYDLSRFLGILSLFDAPEIEIRSSDLVIKGGDKKVVYRFCDENLFVAAPAKELNFPEPEVTFELSPEALGTVLKATGILQLPEIAIVGEDGKLYVRAVNSKDVGSDEFNIAIGDSDHTFTVVFKPEYLSKLVSTKYKVEVSSKKISRFTSENSTYWIATESNSTFA